MSFNGSGVFVINSSGQPVVTGTTISSTVFNAFTNDIANGLTNCITKDGQTTTTSTIPFASAVTMASTLAVTGHVTLEGVTSTGATGTGKIVFDTGPTLAGLLPTGTIIDFAGASTIPTGYLACDGSAVSQATYAALYAVLGTTWNTGGEGAGNFRLPSLARRVLIGSGGSGTGTIGASVGNTGGEETHTLTLPETPSHDHTGTTGGMNSNTTHTHTVQGAQTVGAGNGYASTTINNAGAQFSTDGANIDHTHGFTTSAAGSNGAHNTMQPSAVVQKIIKT